eukprot:3837160-Amphidinium_carterae.2
MEILSNDEDVSATKCIRTRLANFQKVDAIHCKSNTYKHPNPLQWSESSKSVESRVRALQKEFSSNVHL